jgi:hypothetical protein
MQLLIICRQHIGIRTVRQLFFGFFVEFQGRDNLQDEIATDPSSPYRASPDRPFSALSSYAGQANTNTHKSY